MKADELKEAQKAVDAIETIDMQLKWPLASTPQYLTVEHSARSNTTLAINRAVAEKALELQKAEMLKRRAALVRRLNQLGVVL